MDSLELTHGLAVGGGCAFLVLVVCLDEPGWSIVGEDGPAMALMPLGCGDVC
jgi:hypothetical protein